MSDQAIYYVLGAIVGFFAGFLVFYRPEGEDTEYEESAIDTLDLTQPEPVVEEVVQEPEPVTQADGFAVAGPARTIPWSRRKKELEAAARTKRKFREENDGETI